MKTSEIQRFKDLLASSKNILCVSHETPDGDTISSSLGLGLSLKYSGGHNVDFYCKDEIPYNFKFLPGADKYTTTPKRKSYDLIIGFDAAKKRRLFIDSIKYDVLVCIDHHRFGDHYGDINLISVNESATTQVCFDLIKKLKLPLNEEISTNLYAGLYTDTGGFKYGTTNQKSFFDAGRLTKLKADPWHVFSNIYENHPPERIMLLSKVLATLSLEAKGKIAILSLEEKELKSLNCNLDMTDGFINYARGIAGVEVALMLFQSKETIKIDFRGKGNLNVGKLAESLGGSGHSNAARAILHGSIESVKDQIIKTLTPLL